MAKALEGKDVKELLSNIGSGGGAPAAVAAGGAPAAGGAAEAPKEEEKKEEEKEESDDDMVRRWRPFCVRGDADDFVRRASVSSTKRVSPSFLCFPVHRMSSRCTFMPHYRASIKML